MALVQVDELLLLHDSGVMVVKWLLTAVVQAGVRLALQAAGRAADLARGGRGPGQINEHCVV